MGQICLTSVNEKGNGWQGAKSSYEMIKYQKIQTLRENKLSGSFLSESKKYKLLTNNSLQNIKHKI